MPIGVPRIIYCWGEELPAQWTDIYNFIFRRRMVFLMQYLDDELCNQICGLLINIHMEDRSKELEKKEIERSGLFKTASKTQKAQNELGEGQISGGSTVSGSGGLDLTKEGGTSFRKQKIAGPSFEDLLAADEDLGIDENNTLEQYTLQKITMEWLNWNAQFFDYSDEPYLFYLAEMLSKDFNKGDARMLYSDCFPSIVDGFVPPGNKDKRTKHPLPYEYQGNQGSVAKQPLDVVASQEHKEGSGSTAFMQFFERFSSNSQTILKTDFSGNAQKVRKFDHLDIYSPFRLLANFAAQDYNFKEINPLVSADLNNNVLSGYEANSQLKIGEEIKKGSVTNEPVLTNKFNKTDEFSKRELFKLFSSTVKKKGMGASFCKANPGNKTNGYFERKAAKSREVTPTSSIMEEERNTNMSKLFTELGQKSFAQKIKSQNNLFKTSEKVLSQRNLRKEYVQDKTLNSVTNQGFRYNSSRSKWETQNKSSKIQGSSFETSQFNQKNDSSNYLDFYSYNDSYTEFRNTQRGKQTERTLQEEEAKKVFVIINSFGGSVGNGITVHDALQFIKAGSLTLGLGVAASAASLALAGGTIGERYVTEGCHVMIHQPESSIQGQASDIWIDSQEIMKIRLDVAEIYSLATYRPRHKILRDLDRDFYLTATETIHYGLADEIATNEVMHEIIEMTSKVWDYHDTKQQRLLESRDTSNSGLDTQSQN